MKQARERFIEFIRKEPVTSASFLLAFISVFIIPPDKDYFDYIHWSTLSTLLCLMLIMSGLRGLGVFNYLGHKLLSRANTARKLTLVLVGLCFFVAPFATNDVALITFVPFAVDMLLMADLGEYLIPVLSLQTIAAHLGSMISPIGNPHNLYLYGLSGMNAGEFMAAMAPVYLVALTLMVLVIILITRHDKPVGERGERFGRRTSKIYNKPKLYVYLALFALSLMSVMKILPHHIVLPIVIVSIFFFDPKDFKRPDYYLLLTFFFLFIFVGNMGRIEAISSFLSSIVQGNELWVSALGSQVISNVPASILLSGFSDNYIALAIGTDIGGLGTLIASMANLISFKHYARLNSASIKDYIIKFTIINLMFLVPLLIVAGFFC